jgi:hypothetical protein
MIPVNIKLIEGGKVPEYKSEGAAEKHFIFSDILLYLLQ